MRSSRLLGTTGPVVCPSTALLRIEFTAPFRLRTVGELLPRLSTLTCPKAGGISLLHLSWGHPRRALPVILALWSPDFPHLGPFGSHPRLSGPVAWIVYSFFKEKSNKKAKKNLAEPKSSSPRREVAFPSGEGGPGAARDG